MRSPEIRPDIRGDNVQDHPSRKMASGNLEASISAMSWTSILGGSAAAIAVTLVLLVLGSGLGFATISPWQNEGLSATTLTVMAAVWMIIVQWVSAGIGGYLTGRLRTKWVGMHTDEVFFRDTAHGFLSWAVATIVTAAFLASAMASAVSGSAKAATAVAAGAAMGAEQGSTPGAQAMSPVVAPYFLDTLFRSDRPVDNPADARAESTRILTRGIVNGDVPLADRERLARLVADRTGLAQPEAARRVDGVIADINNAKLKTQEVADKAKKAAATVSIFTALSMLIGAFIAALSASMGGRHRDSY